MRRLAVALPLEGVPEAVVEAEAAARWYAARSLKASAGFIEEVDAAISLSLTVIDDLIIGVLGCLVDTHVPGAGHPDGQASGRFSVARVTRSCSSTMARTSVSGGALPIASTKAQVA